MVLWGVKKIKIVTLLWALCLGGTFSLFGHFTWVDILEGKEPALVLGHGHRFPQSEQALIPQDINLEIVFVDGGKQKAPLQKEGPCLVSLLAGIKKKIDHAVYEAKPVIFTKTTTGWKKGPKKAFNNAVSSLKILRFGRLQEDFNGSMVSSASRVELLLKRENDAYRLVFHQGGKPVPAVDITYWLAGEKEERQVGKTDTSGSVRLGNLKPGKYLFSGEYSSAVKCDSYDVEQVSVSLTLTIR